MVYPKDNLLKALAHDRPYWLPCPMFDKSVIVVSHGLKEHCLEGEDAWGVEWTLRDERSGSFPTGHPIKNPDSVDDYRFPSPERVDLTRAVEAVRKVDRRETMVAGDNGWGLFERAWLLVGMEKLFVWSYKYPDAVKRLIERIAEVKVRLTERLVEEVGVEMILYGDDWGMNDRLLFTERWWMDFIMPWQAKLYATAKRYDVLVYQHSDGRVEELLPHLVELGVDIVNIQAECNDWLSIKRKYGEKLTLWGGVSARTLDLGTLEDVEREVRTVAELGRDGGIVLAPGHSLKFPPENVEAMKLAWLKYGAYSKSSLLV